MRELTPEQKQYLIDLKKKPNEDTVRLKEMIKQILLDNDTLMYLLHNKELEEVEAENDEYFGTDGNIRSSFIIPETQTEVKHFLCFECMFEASSGYNPAIKYEEIVFYILCNDKDLVVDEIGAARHDLIAALLIDVFNGTNKFGLQLKLLSDKPSVTDNHYATRTLVFERISPNSMTRADGTTFNIRRGGQRR